VRLDHLLSKEPCPESATVLRASRGRPGWALRSVSFRQLWLRAHSFRLSGRRPWRAQVRTAGLQRSADGRPL